MEKCWANILGNCGDKISREHLISKGIFADRSFRVKGFSWCKNEYKNVGIEAITRKCLCTTHNNLLTDVDNEGVRLFQVLDKIAELSSASREPTGTGNDDLHVFNGNLLERWFLKTLINVSYNSNHHLGEFGEITGRPHEYLVHVAFGKVPFSHYMGLYSLVLDGHKGVSRSQISITPVIKNNEIIGGAVFSFRGMDFFLSLTPSIPPYKLGYLDIKGFQPYILDSVLMYRCPKMAWSRNGASLYTVNVLW